MWLKRRKDSVHGKHEWSHTKPSPLYSLYLIRHVISLLSYHLRGPWRTRQEASLWCADSDQMRIFFFNTLYLSVMFWFGERRPQRCMDWWEGMMYVAPVSQLSSGLLSLITAIRLPLHCSTCLRRAITAPLLSHTHKGKGHFPSLPSAESVTKNKARIYSEQFK